MTIARSGDTPAGAGVSAGVTHLGSRQTLPICFGGQTSSAYELEHGHASGEPVRCSRSLRSLRVVLIREMLPALTDVGVYTCTRKGAGAKAYAARNGPAESLCPRAGWADQDIR